MKTNRPVLAALLLAAAGLCLSSCSVLGPTGPDDCGYQASFAPPKEGERAEITISIVTAEIVNNRKNCGFGFSPVRADKVSINGASVPEKVNGAETHYIAPAGFDPRKDPIQIEAIGKRYISDLTSVITIDKRETVRLRPLPAK